MKSFKINSLVDGTSTNSAGYQLYCILEKHFSTARDQMIEIDLKGSLGISSSFFNSSFGRLIEEKGFDSVVKRIKFINVPSNQRRLLKSYFDSYKEMSSLARV